MTRLHSELMPASEDECGFTLTIIGPLAQTLLRYTCSGTNKVAAEEVHGKHATYQGHFVIFYLIT